MSSSYVILHLRNGHQRSLRYMPDNPSFWAAVRACEAAGGWVQFPENAGIVRDPRLA